MSKLYHEIMGNIQLTPGTKEQILRHIAERERKEKVKKMKRWTRYVSVAACCAIVFGAVYGIHSIYQEKGSRNDEMNPADVAEDGQVQIANPMKEYDSAEELSEAVGFTINDISELPFSVEETSYFSYDDTLAEIRYTGFHQEVNFRKSKGEEDNSGVYNTYNQETTVTVGAQKVICKGTDDKYELAIWQTEGYSYSISLQNSISLEQLQSIIENVEKQNGLEEGFLLSGSVTQICISFSPEGKKYELTDAESIEKVVDYLRTIELENSNSENPDDYDGMVSNIQAVYADGTEYSVQLMANLFIRKDNGPWYQIKKEDRIRWDSILEEIGQS